MTSPRNAKHTPHHPSPYATEDAGNPPSSFPDYPSLLSHLDACGLFTITPGLDRIRAVLERLGLGTPPYAVVQVVGTNGKGSTCAMLASLAAAHGLRVGLYTSPHFLSPRERIRINGSLLAPEEWTQLANAVFRAQGQNLSYFELLTAMAALAFAEARVDLAVMETGLGGSWDAVTALYADRVIFTPIALDHQNILGSTLADIAADKAGAMRSGTPALTLIQTPEAQARLDLAAKTRGVPLAVLPENASEPLPTDTLSLAGPHQIRNARLALACWRSLTQGPHGSRQDTPANDAPIPHTSRIDIFNKFPVSDLTAEALGLRSAWLPGRMHRTLPRAPQEDAYSPCSLGRPPLLLDGAHNPHAMAALGLALAKAGIGPAAVIFTCLADKQPEQIIPHLRALATGPIFVPPLADNPRAMPPEELAPRIGVNAIPVGSCKEALERASELLAERLPGAFTGKFPENPVLVCGSLYLLAECYALFPEILEETP